MNMPQLRKKVRFSFEGKNLSLFELKAMILEGEIFFKIEKLNQSLKKLDVEDKSILLMKYQDEFSIKDIASTF